jgi:hypothetical protein
MPDGSVSAGFDGAEWNDSTHGEGRRALAHVVERLVRRIGSVDVPIHLHRVKLAGMGRDTGYSLLRRVAGRSPDIVDLNEGVFGVVCACNAADPVAFEARLAHQLASGQDNARRPDAALSSLSCHSTEVVDAGWLVTCLEAEPERVVLPRH